ncbi:hypothetical protein NUW54_g5604 [Trametes sanguinea]|uniref:Uncharacterized protein n=1 Tax=Trametes sanguinea TaxID=158606 RepID=A0ACC1PXM9_9APHY|nr:hypothetical protein NUW54_g5604 [Trametes sanguinea]
MFGDCPTTGWRKYATYQKNRWKLALVMEVVVRDDVPEPPEKANIPPPCPFVKWVGDRGSDDGGRVRVLDPEDDARPRVFHDVGNAPGEPTSIRQHQTAITPHAWHGTHNLPGTCWFYVNPLFLLFFHVQGPVRKKSLGSEKKIAVVTARFDRTTGEMARRTDSGMASRTLVGSSKDTPTMMMMVMVMDVVVPNVAWCQSTLVPDIRPTVPWPSPVDTIPTYPTYPRPPLLLVP